MPRRAVLFDVDGTLLDTLPGLREVWRAWSALHGLDADVVFAEALRGRPRETFLTVAPTLSTERCLLELHALEDRQAQESGCVAFEGADKLLRELSPNDWAIVTSNYARRVRWRFTRAGLPAPLLVVDAESVDRGKPHPDGYLRAADLLSRDPADCLVLEDSEAGVAAALTAGMTVWAVNTPQATAHRSFRSLAHATPEVATWMHPDPQ